MNITNRLPVTENHRILIVEDDPDIAALTQLHLQDYYQDVIIAGTGTEGLRLAMAQTWTLLILDIRLPGKDGLAVCRELRASGSNVPILMLTSKSSELDRVLGLEMGADDYLVKPFSILELVARVKAMIRRVTELSHKSHNEAAELVNPKYQLVLNTSTHIAEKNGGKLELTPKEFDLLSYFLQNPGKVFSRAHLLNRIWGHVHDGYEHTVNSHINRLRAKIEDDPTTPEIITTVWGVGYKLN